MTAANRFQMVAVLVVVAGVSACAANGSMGPEDADPTQTTDPFAHPTDLAGNGGVAGMGGDVTSSIPDPHANIGIGGTVPTPSEPTAEPPTTPVTETPTPIEPTVWELGAPLDVPANEQWTWVPLEGTKCADGTTAGVGVNFTGRSRELVIWFQGNGVCYDLVSCTLFQNLLTGMGPNPLDHLWWGDPNTQHTGVFDRNDPANPLRNASFVVFPHCGVDGHSADKTSSYPPLPTYHQHGYRNVTIALSRIVPTFEDATRIVVAGFSAGGIGAGANYHQIADAFESVGHVPPYLINDAGPIQRPPYLGTLAHSSLRKGWGLDQTIEKWCPDCATEGYHAGMRAIAELHPGVRVAVISSYVDNVAMPLYGMLNADITVGLKYEAGLRDLATWAEGLQSTTAPSVERFFFYPGDRHGAISIAPLGATPGLLEFLNGQLSESSSWSSVKP